MEVLATLKPRGSTVPTHGIRQVWRLPPLHVRTLNGVLCPYITVLAFPLAEFKVIRLDPSEQR